MNKKSYLFYDTETTGLPENWAAPITNSANWPHIVSIAWSKQSEEQEVISQGCIIVKPNGYIVPEASTKVHGITHAQAVEVGTSLQTVMSVFAAEFCTDKEELVTTVAHNVSFDKRVVGAEFHRLELQKTLELFNALPSICTMKESTDFCALPNPKFKNTFKYPQLKELHFKLFGTYPDKQHTADGDTAALARCFFKLKERGIIK